MATYTSWGALEGALQDKMNRATETAVKDSFVDLQQNVQHFYDIPEGRYKRTNRLASSPEIEFAPGGNVATGEIGLNTDHQYYPAGISTLDIYNLAESGYLLGIPEFWLRTKQQINKHVYDAFSREFG